MSSGVEAGGLVVAAVALPAMAAFGAGWLAWQAGKALVGVGVAANAYAEAKKRELAEAACQRKQAALGAHRQLVDMCGQILTQIEGSSAASGVAELAELEQLKYDLKAICQTSLPEDAAEIESITRLGFIKLDSIISKHKQLSSLRLSDSEAGLYRGLAVADLMDDLRIAISAMEIYATKGTDVKAADPAVLERAKLNQRFYQVTDQIIGALQFVAALDAECGLNCSGDAWFHSCFDGVDQLIATLCLPTTSNKDLKKGILKLEEALEQYRVFAPSIEKEIKTMLALYEVYCDACKALGEPIASLDTFTTSAELEAALQVLKTRSLRAQQCAEIYQKLGPSAYLCYAWDQELQALGYKVHSRKQISEIAKATPDHALLGGSKLPFYRWRSEDLTQLYSISDNCDLQLIIHEDGTVSMQTIADSDEPAVVAAQEAHCEQLKLLHARLRENWFVMYDYEETESAQIVTTAAGWRTAATNPWTVIKPAEVHQEEKKQQKKKQTPQTPQNP